MLVQFPELVFLCSMTAGH